MGVPEVTEEEERVNVVIIHFAYNVVATVTVSVVKFHAVVSQASLYHPAKVYPVFVGGVGAVIVVL